MRLAEILQDSEFRFIRIGQVLPDVLKEVAYRFELRQRLEAERGGSISDHEFLQIVERSSGVEL